MDMIVEQMMDICWAIGPPLGYFKTLLGTKIFNQTDLILVVDHCIDQWSDLSSWKH